ncbi:hypothetical protein BV25DRAFT_695207 [Artomyces pyxidatus]|uniref:Uncharacterized protein n=1 Tax=Artomyces pyxidatus TaxID=48021 RepID=A0ACB8T038_9AGAM|nr:hypothetical protein BV25DRAFT_695207 [Artomyces pyxidatus]
MIAAVTDLLSCDKTKRVQWTCRPLSQATYCTLMLRHSLVDARAGGACVANIHPGAVLRCCQRQNGLREPVPPTGASGSGGAAVHQVKYLTPTDLPRLIPLPLYSLLIGSDRPGKGTVTGDMLYASLKQHRAPGWHSISHGGFYTFPRHDSSGFAQYVYPRSGAQIWAIERPQATVPQSTDDRIAFQKAICKAVKRPYPPPDNSRVLLLEPGSVL